MAEQLRSEEEARRMADPRYTEVPIPCQHCKNLISMGDQFTPEGWTCKAFPEQIPYRVLTLRDPHTSPDVNREGVAVFDPVIYTEDDTRREWHYTADGDWVYVDEE